MRAWGQPGIDLMILFKKGRRQFLVLCLAGLVMAGCMRLSQPQSIDTRYGSLPMLGYVIQIGAFSDIDNAVSVMNKLRDNGVDAYYFKDDDALYKVRFGDFAFLFSAKRSAAALQRESIINDFFIVNPAEYSAAGDQFGDSSKLRKKITKTARRFLGVPYKWGGESANEGFDCSGLTMTVYRLNGLSLPRNSRQQFQAGKAVKKDNLKPGDLVFFATKGGSRVTHVGIFIGKNSFIHAPRTGKTIRVASLDDAYFAKYYRGGRTFLAEDKTGGYF